jgi:hypothetical protein
LHFYINVFVQIFLSTMQINSFSKTSIINAQIPHRDIFLKRSSLVTKGLYPDPREKNGSIKNWWSGEKFLDYWILQFQISSGKSPSQPLISAITLLSSKRALSISPRITVNGKVNPQQNRQKNSQRQKSWKFWTRKICWILFNNKFHISTKLL